MSDRSEVSGEAEAVWDRYMSSRPDVRVVQLDITEDFEEPQLTPNDKSDDCSQVPAYDRHGKKWFESSLAKKYMKKTLVLKINWFELGKIALKKP